MEQKIKYRNLSGGLKTAIVLLWILIGCEGIAFVIGFIKGAMIAMQYVH